MELTATAPLIRGMMALRRAGAEGVVLVHTARGQAALRLVRGLPTHMDWDVGGSETLGDLLLRHGDLNGEAHARALSALPPRGPVGPWLAQVGAASSGAVAYAGRLQLRQRFARLLATEIHDFRFVPDSGERRPRGEPVPLGALAMPALRGLARGTTFPMLEARHPSLFVKLSCSGEVLLEGAALWPEEQALLGPLRAGTTIETLRAVGRGTPRAAGLLRVLLAVERGESEAPPASYPILMRKRREVRTAVTPRRLLELSAGSGPRDARRALRRFARQLHPDRFGDGPLRGVAEEVFSALVSAAAEVGA